MSRGYRPQFNAEGKRVRRKGGRPAKRLAAAIRERDMVVGNGRCANPTCGRDLRGQTVEVDHVIPCRLSFDELEFEAGDLICLCYDCNKAKGGDRYSDVWFERALLQEIERRNAAMGIPQTPAAELIARWQ